MAQVQRASILDVDFGFAQIEGLMLPDGSYAIAVSQIATHFSFSPSNATKTVKALLGKGCELFRVSSEIANRPVNTVTLDQFKRVVLGLSKQGHPTAQAFVEALVVEGIERRFDTAAGVKVEESERNRRLYERMISRKDFRPLTDQLKAHGFTSPEDYRIFVGKFQKVVGIKAGGRDSSDAQTLAHLNVVQTRLTTLMECGVTPWEALKRI